MRLSSDICPAPASRRRVALWLAHYFANQEPRFDRAEFLAAAADESVQRRPAANGQGLLPRRFRSSALRARGGGRLAFSPGSRSIGKA